MLMQNKVNITIIPKLAPLLTSSKQMRVRAAYGGRGSGKTRSFALMSAIRGLLLGSRGIKGTILCARQFQKSLAESSLEEVKRAIETYPFLQDYYEIGENYIKSEDGNIKYKFVGLARNLSSIKSMGRLLLVWVDEAEPVTEEAWRTLVPTLRDERHDWSTELWVTWNPLRVNAAVEKRFRKEAIKVNWQDNPWFPAILDEARKKDLNERPEYYDHIWEGEYLRAAEGAYYSKQLAQASTQGRIGFCAADPLLPIKAFWDIGGTGASSDATAIWIAQFIGHEIRVLSYYEAQGQALSEHIGWLRNNGYSNALMVLPHDGKTKDRVYDASFESALRSAGFNVEVISNQGVGAVAMRIEAVRRLFPMMWFNKATTSAGLEALAWYHEKRDEARSIGLGANHDWSSHGADAFGLMAIAYEQPKKPRNNSYEYIANNSWMAG